MERTFKVSANRLSEIIEDAEIDVVNFDRASCSVTISFDTEQDAQNFETYCLDDTV